MFRLPTRDRNETKRFGIGCLASTSRTSLSATPLQYLFTLRCVNLSGIVRCFCSFENCSCVNSSLVSVGLQMWSFTRVEHFSSTDRWPSVFVRWIQLPYFIRVPIYRQSSVILHSPTTRLHNVSLLNGAELFDQAGLPFLTLHWLDSVCLSKQWRS